MRAPRPARRSPSRPRLAGVWPALGALALGLIGGACGDSGGADGPGAPTEVFVEPAPGGIRRLTSSQLRFTVEYLLGPDAAALVPLADNPARLRGFEAIAAAELAYSATEVDDWEADASDVVDAALDDLTYVARFAPCVQEARDEACYVEVAREVGRVAFRRTLDADEVARFAALGTAGRVFGEGDFDEGLRFLLLGLLQAPSFLYQVELGVPHASLDGQFVLTPTELASRMSLFLLHRGPDAALLDAADAGALDGDEGVREAALAMLEAPEARRSIERFYGELYGIEDLGNVNHTAELYPAWGEELAASAREEMLRFVTDVVLDRDADARELFTSTETFVDARLAALYGVSGPSAGWQRVSLPPEHLRAGLLGKAGFLARYAHPAFTSPTRRGRFVWEKLLCDPVPDPPPGVDISLPPDPPDAPQTMRQKLEVHMEEPSCSTCHRRVDPVGLALEHFDAIGRHRPDDRGLPIDTAGEYVDLGSFASAADLGALLAEDERATACVVRNFVRGSMGHLELPGEEAEIEALAARFADGGYRVRGLMVDLVLSPAFRRVGAPK